MNHKNIAYRRARVDIDGILLLDKATGISSNGALQQIKRLLNARKAGHTGSLDPLASGMLPLCLGEATKFSQFLLEADKVYSVTAALGTKTATGDAEGEIIATHPVQVSKQTLLQTLDKFRGAIEQIPSMYSALKHQGKPLYELARQGIEVERKARTVTITQLDLLNFDGQHFAINVHCSKGTYIRTLIDDVGEALGCGAYVTALRRTRVMPYTAEQMVSLAELEELKAKDPVLLKKYILPIDSLIEQSQEVNLSEAAAFYLRRGQPVIVPYAPAAGLVKLRLKDGTFLGMGEMMADGRVAPRRLVKIN